MRKIIILSVCILLSALLCSCKNSSTVDSIIDAQETASGTEFESEIPTESETPPETEVSSETSTTQSTKETVSEDVPVADVDLTTMSSTMVYAEVYNIINAPEDYFGKRIKLQGQYYPFYADETQKNYYYVIVADATACCQQGIEFIWDGGTHTFPDEYPSIDSIVEISGIYRSYEENGITYCYVDADSLVVIIDGNEFIY